MRMMKEGKKKYVTPSVCVHEMESCPLLAGSEGVESLSPTVKNWDDGENLGGGELEL